MTFSLIAVCPTTKRVGTVVTSSSICVASRCSFVAGGVGAAQSQNITDPDLGPQMLAMARSGLSPKELMAKIVADTHNIQWRQLGLVNLDGKTAVFTGDESLGIHATAEGTNCAAMGNMLESTAIPQAMVSAFEKTQAEFPERLLAALEAGLAAGGEAGPIHSAGIKVAAKANWPVIDLRVDWEDEPDQAISKLRDTWNVYHPQMQAYITRAADPAESESYGVPGDP